MSKLTCSCKFLASLFWTAILILPSSSDPMLTYKTPSTSRFCTPPSLPHVNLIFSSTFIRTLKKNFFTKCNNFALHFNLQERQNYLSTLDTVFEAGDTVALACCLLLGNVCLTCCSMKAGNTSLLEPSFIARLGFEEIELLCRGWE